MEGDGRAGDTCAGFVGGRLAVVRGVDSLAGGVAPRFPRDADGADAVSAFGVEEAAAASAGSALPPSAASSARSSGAGADPFDTAFESCVALASAEAAGEGAGFAAATFVAGSGLASPFAAVLAADGGVPAAPSAAEGSAERLPRSPVPNQPRALVIAPLVASGKI
jgi:hypothetical protein